MTHTSTQQPEALRLVEWIESDMSCDGDADIVAELLRQHARIEELEAQLAAAQGWKPVQIELLERIQESLGSFLSDQGWSQSDMDTADALDGLLAAAPQPPEAALAQEGWCDGCSPDNCCGCGPSQQGAQP